MEQDFQSLLKNQRVGLLIMFEATERHKVILCKLARFEGVELDSRSCIQETA
jgi:hypothetical protein